MKSVHLRWLILVALVLSAFAAGALWNRQATRQAGQVAAAAALTHDARLPANPGPATATRAAGAGSLSQPRSAAAAAALPEQSTVRLALQRRLMAEYLELRRIQLPERLDDQVKIDLNAGGGALQLALTRHSVRGGNFKVLVQAGDGSFTEVPAGPVRSYVGNVTGSADSFVGAMLLESGLSAQVSYSQQPSLFVAPLTAEETAVLGRDVPGDAPLHAVYVQQDYHPADECPVIEPARGEPRTSRLTPSQMNGMAGEYPLMAASGFSQNKEPFIGDLPVENFAGNNANGRATFTPLQRPHGSRPIVTSTMNRTLKRPASRAPVADEEFPVAAAPGPTITVKQAEMGFDVGYSFFSGRCGSSIATTIATIEDWMNVTQNPTYVPGALVEHVIGVIVVRTNTATDPYNGMGDAYTILPKIKEIWNGANATYPSPGSTHDLATCVLNQGIGVTGLASVGVIGTSSKYSVCTAASGMGYWKSGLRHEVGHNWSLSHGDGCGEPLSNANEFGVMCGGPHERLNSVESSKVISHRNSRSAGVLVDIGLYPAGKPYGPYCAQNITYTSGVGAGSVVLDVLGNDHDANGDTFYIDALMKRGDANRIWQTPAPVSVPTVLGGTVIRSVGTGPGGRDTVIYTPPAAGGGGADEFFYWARDPGGTGGSGFVRVTVGAPPPDAYGEIVRTGVRADTVLDWTSDSEASFESQWQNGYYSTGTGGFLTLTNVATFSTWIGANGDVRQNVAAEPRVGQYAQNPSVAWPAVRRWTSDYHGSIAIEYNAHRLRSGGNGLTMSIAHNSVTLWSQFLTNTAPHFTGTLYANVKPGDTIDLIASANGDLNYDWAHFQARIHERFTAREDSALAFHYRMDEAGQMGLGEGGDYDRRSWATDSSGHNRPARAFNTDNNFVWNIGVMGNSFDADGSDDYLETVANNLGDGATEVTLAAWVNPDAKVLNGAAVSTTGPDFCGLVFSSYGAGLPAEFRIRTQRITGPDNSVPTNKWSHLVGVWKSGQYHRLYLDGVEIVTTNFTTTPGGVIDVDKWLIGKDRTFNDRDFNGRIDDVALWTRAFDSREVQALYEQGRRERNYNGTSDVEFVGDPLVGPAFTEITLSAWLNPDIKGNNDGIMSSAGDYFALTMSGSAGKDQPVQFRAKNNGLDAPTNTSPVGEWLHAVGVWKSGVFQKLYLDGALASTSPTPATGTATITLATNSWTIGRDRTFGDRYFDGRIADPLVIGRALTDEEVLNLYQQGRTAFDAAHGILNGAAAIGTLTLAGSLLEASGDYTLNASGTTLGGTSDNLQFARLNHSGAGEVTLRVDALEDTTNAFAGIMLRATTNANSAFVMLAMRPDHSVSLTQRTNTGSALNFVANWQPGPTNAVWLKLLRSGDAIAARVSSNGVTWTQLGVARGTFAGNAIVGVASGSGTQAALATAVVGGLSASPFTDVDVDLDGVPDAWEMASFGTTATSSGAASDFDSDGASDYAEWVAGTSATNAASIFKLTATCPAPGNVLMAWPGATNRTYRLLGAPTVSGAWTEIEAGITPTLPTTSRTLPATNAASFYRVQVSYPGP